MAEVTLINCINQEYGKKKNMSGFNAIKRLSSTSLMLLQNKLERLTLGRKERIVYLQVKQGGYPS